MQPDLADQVNAKHTRSGSQCQECRACGDAHFAPVSQHLVLRTRKGDHDGVVSYPVNSIEMLAALLGNLERAAARQLCGELHKQGRRADVLADIRDRERRGQQLNAAGERKDDSPNSPEIDPFIDLAGEVDFDSCQHHAGETPIGVLEPARYRNDTGAAGPADDGAPMCTSRSVEAW